MKKIFILSLLFAAVFAIGCEDTWDKHFNGEEQGEGSRSELNLFGYLESKPEYSKFFQLLNQTVAGKELAKEQVLTCWIVADENMADLSAVDSASKEQIVKNHINNMALYAPKLENGKIVKMISGKNLLLNLDEENVFSLDGQQLVKMNQLCANGVAHEISALMMPRQSIFDYVVSADDEYSVFRNYLLSCSDTLFRPDKSFPIGVNETGNTVYDSVFEIINPFFSKADIRDENNDYTLFLPSNQNISEAINDITTFYSKGLTLSDTLLFFDWIMKAVFYKEKIENYYELEALESVFQKDWRTAYQPISGQPYEASNGLVYKMQKIHIPLNLLVKSYENILPAVYSKLTPQQKGEFVIMENRATKLESLVNGDYFWMAYNSGGNDERSLTWTMTDVDQFGNITSARFVPGKYKLQASFRPFYCGKNDIIVNGKVISANYDLGAKQGQDKKYFDFGEVTIPESDGLARVQVKFLWKSGGDKRIVVRGIKLIADPTSIY